ncbi:hypothetical protein SS50377_26121 [Spironucleus salmonicida]|uniref:Uncharacterized protein n=1 Tax=Spironucleus salmonicida TaxID=348837 RepID=V6LNS8_9EUKA|nr:hypothetical protein SS50377_26121 [Spironucleus salmonicida]|eukprot:EST46327.1 Hypothetical protein SS50377_13638 [Spironucleus salmonicida]
MIIPVELYTGQNQCKLALLYADEYRIAVYIDRCIAFSQPLSQVRLALNAHRNLLRVQYDTYTFILASRYFADLSNSNFIGVFSVVLNRCRRVRLNIFADFIQFGELRFIRAEINSVNLTSDFEVQLNVGISDFSFEFAEARDCRDAFSMLQGVKDEQKMGGVRAVALDVRVRFGAVFDGFE